MVAAANLQSPRPNPTTTRTPPPAASNAAPAAASAPAAAPATDAPPRQEASAPDSYDRSRAPSNPAPRPSSGPAVPADPELARQARSNMVNAHVGGPSANGQSRGVAYTHSDPGDLSQGNVSQAQTNFRNEMRDALGRNVHQPPNEGELRQYFRTFRGRPEEAVQAYERYSDAYARHDGEHDYRSRDRQYVLDRDGRVLSGRPEAERLRRQGENYTYYENNAPNNHNEATRDRGRDRRSNMDCEGYAVTADTLLGEAGLTTRHVVGNTSRTDGHAVAVATDPASGRQWVMSNGDAYAVGRDGLRPTLDRAYGDTVMQGRPSVYYEGRSQDEAAFRQMRGATDGRIE